jgi:hypothetical protein
MNKEETKYPIELTKFELVCIEMGLELKTKEMEGEGKEHLSETRKKVIELRGKVLTKLLDVLD